MKSRYSIGQLGEVLTPALDQHEVQASSQYPIAGVYGFGRGLFAREPITGEETKYARLNYLQSGALVLSRLKAFEGAIAVIPDEFDGFFLSSEFPTFSIDQNRADANYIKHMCAWPELWEELRRGSKGIGARRERVNVDKLLTTEAPLPDLDEQRRIAAKLDTLHGRVQSSLNLIEYSRGLSTQLLDSYLREVESSASLGDFLSRSDDLVEVAPEERYETAGIYSYGRGLFRRPVIYGSETKYTRYSRLHHGQFVYSKLFAWEGSVAMVPESFEGIHVSQEFPAFDIDESIADPAYVAHLVRWPELRKRLAGGTSGMGSRRQRVNVNQLLATEVPLPGISVQRAIATKLDKLSRVESGHSGQKEHLKALRSCLLNAAFGGKL